MSETKFTRGPWLAHVSRGLHFIQAEGGLSIAVCHDAALGNGDDEANAHLIAAAPELYKACEALLRTWFDYHDAHSLTEPVTGASGTAADKAIAALEKARGEQS